MTCERILDFSSLPFRTKFLMKRPGFKMPINAAVCSLAFGIALPFAIALFPQQSKVPKILYLQYFTFVALSIELDAPL